MNRPVVFRLIIAIAAGTLLLFSCKTAVEEEPVIDDTIPSVKTDLSKPLSVSDDESDKRKCSRLKALASSSESGDARWGVFVYDLNSTSTRLNSLTMPENIFC